MFPSNLWSSILGSTGTLGPAALAQQTQYNSYSALLHKPYISPSYPSYNPNTQMYDWVWNGKPVTLTEFAELAYGDTPERSMFILKYSYPNKGESK